MEAEPKPSEKFAKKEGFHCEKRKVLLIY